MHNTLLIYFNILRSRYSIKSRISCMLERDLHFYVIHRQTRNHINLVPFSCLEKKLIILKTSFKNKNKLKSSN